MAWNGNTTEMKTDIAKFISFRFKFCHFRFVSVFRNFFHFRLRFKIFPLTDISVSVSINVNHTAPHVSCGFCEVNQLLALQYWCNYCHCWNSGKLTFSDFYLTSQFFLIFQQQNKFMFTGFPLKILKQKFRLDSEVHKWKTEKVSSQNWWQKLDIAF